MSGESEFDIEFNLFGQNYDFFYQIDKICAGSLVFFCYTVCS
jgi:hypothetical protein